MNRIICSLICFVGISVSHFFIISKTTVPCKVEATNEIENVINTVSSTALNNEGNLVVIDNYDTSFKIENQYCTNIVPLSIDEQEALLNTCEEFDIPYTLALGLIEKETNFKNIIGDNGASSGYMQIQKRWHSDRMKRLNATDLMNPNENFRVGADYLSELYKKHDNWGIALTVYNMGHNPGYISSYAYDVLDNYAKWQELINIYD